MNNGWIKLYRCLMDSSVFANPNILKVWIWCLLKASHSERQQLVGLQVVDLKEGQFIFGRKKAAEKLCMKESTVWKCMKTLENLGNISINSNNKFSVITVEKWGDYQGDDTPSVTTKEQQSNNNVTTKEQQSNTNKNVKNVKNDKNVNNRGAQNKFVPPTFEQVKDYCWERCNSVDPESFINFYESKNWMIGKNKMKDWKAAVRTWERRDNKPVNKTNKNQTAQMLDDFYGMMEDWASNE